MYYALLYYPRILNDGFHAFRNKYEPYAKLLAEHIPFVYPVPEKIGWKALENHIWKVLSHWEPFFIHISGHQLTWDNWLIMTVKEGEENIYKLHDELYTGILTPHLRVDLPYIPHIAMGLFSKENYDTDNPTFQSTLDENKYQKALSEVEEMQMDFWRTIESLTLVKVNEHYTKCWDIEEFRF
ncbi:MAG TPA: 2'-5' RNA ligase family protein [Bacteroidales bacterium]